MVHSARDGSMHTFCNGGRLQILYRGSQQARCSQKEARRTLAVGIFRPRGPRRFSRQLLVRSHCIGRSSAKKCLTSTKTSGPPYVLACPSTPSTIDFNALRILLIVRFANFRPLYKRKGAPGAPFSW